MADVHVISRRQTVSLLLIFFVLSALLLPEVCSASGFTENFDDGIADNWTDDGSRAWSVLNSVYTIKPDASPAKVFFSHYNDLFTDFTYKADVKQVSGAVGNGYGLIFRTDGTYNNGYIFHISSDGYYLIFKRVLGVTSYLIANWTFSPAIVTGLDKFNTLEVTCQGPAIEFKINGTLVSTVNDNSLPSGKAGLKAFGSSSVQSLGRSTTDLFSFDNVSLTVSGGLQVNVATGSNFSGCGGVASPCKTITYALSQTSGNSPISVAAGTYGISSGEIFPLTLKPGTALLCLGPNHTTAIQISDLVQPYPTGIIGAAGALVDGCYLSSGGLKVADNSSTMTITNNLMDLGCGGISLQSNSTVSNNIIQGMGGPCSGSAAINIYGGSPVVSGNTLINNTSALAIAGGTPSVNNNIIKGNTSGIGIDTPGNPVISTNTISCNLGVDLRNNTASAINARNNLWDNLPPFQISYPAACPSTGEDICNSAANGSVDITGYTLAATPCPRPKAWTHPLNLSDNLSPNSTDAVLPHIAARANGAMVVVWEQFSGVNWQIFKSEFRNNVWTSPLSLTDVISPAGNNAAAARAAMDNNANTIVVWEQSNGTNWRILKSEFRNGTWTHPGSLSAGISPSGTSAINADVAMDNVGNAIIVWEQLSGANWQIFKSEFRNGMWTNSRSLSTISPNGSDATNVRVAMDDNGNAIAVWKQWDGVNWQIFKSEFRSGAWSNPTGLTIHISPGGFDASNPQVAMDNSGNALITWQQKDGANWQIFKSEFRSNAWSHPSSLANNISPDGTDAIYPQVKMDNSGNALITWQQKVGANWQIFKSEFRGGAWSHPSSLANNISPDSTDAANPQVAMDSSGNALVVWEQSDGTNWQIFKSEFRSGAWSHPSSLTDNASPDGTNTSHPIVSMDNAGNAIIIWSQPDGSSVSQIFKSEYR